MINETKPPREVWCLVNDSGEAWDGTSDQELASSIARMAVDEGEGPTRVERYIHAAVFDEAIAGLRDIMHDPFCPGGQRLAFNIAIAMLVRLRDGGGA